jgi:hypothetical protein
MIIDHFDVDSVAVFPAKAYSPLFVNPYAVLTLPVSGQLLQLVSRRYHQIIEAFGGVQNQELPQSLSANVLRKPGCLLPQKYLLRVFTAKALYHYDG